MAKYKERIRAREMRRGGQSIGEIASQLEISKSTVSLWCSDIGLSEKQIKCLAERHSIRSYVGRLHAAENRRKERLVRVEKFGVMGKDKVGTISRRDLFMLGLGLYWAEGAKKNRDTRFVNSDPAMIRLWIKWLSMFANVDISNLSFCVGINQEHRSRIEEVMRYWARVSGANTNQFRMPSFKKINNKKTYSNFENHFGSLTVIVRKGTNLNYEILGMIEAARGTARHNHGKISGLAG